MKNFAACIWLAIWIMLLPTGYGRDVAEYDGLMIEIFKGKTNNASADCLVKKLELLEVDSAIKRKVIYSMVVHFFNKATLRLDPVAIKKNDKNALYSLCCHVTSLNEQAGGNGTSTNYLATAFYPICCKSKHSANSDQEGKYSAPLGYIGNSSQIFQEHYACSSEIFTFLFEYKVAVSNEADRARINETFRKCEGVKNVSFVRDDTRVRVKVRRADVTSSSMLNCYFQKLQKDPAGKFGQPSEVLCPETLHENFYFPETFPNSKGISENDTCEPGKGGERAVMICGNTFTLNSDGSYTVEIQFKNETFLIHNCSITVEKVLEEIHNLSAETEVEQIGLSIITTGLSSEAAANVSDKFISSSQNITESGKVINTSILQTAVDIVSSLSSAYAENETLSATASSKSKQEVFQALQNIARRVTMSAFAIVYSRLSMVVQLQDIIVDKLVDQRKASSDHRIGFLALSKKQNNESSKTTGKQQQQEPSIGASVPYEALASASGNTIERTGVRVSFVFVTDGSLFPSEKGISQIISTEIINSENPDNATNIKYLKKPMLITFYEKKIPYGRHDRMEGNVRKTKFAWYQCVYFEEVHRIWSVFGNCLNIIQPITTCESNHLSVFSILFNYKDAPNSFVLATVSQVGCYVTIVCLFVTILLYILHKKLRSSTSTKIQLHIYVCLMIAYLAFVVGVEKIEYNYVCTAVSVAMHFMFLASFLWTTVYAKTLYTKVCYKGIHIEDDNIMLKGAFYAYGLPTLILVVTLGVSYGYFDRIFQNPFICDAGNLPFDPSYYNVTYRESHLCWIRTQVHYISFLPFVALSLVYNLGVTTLVVKRLVFRKNENLRSNVKKMTISKQLMMVCTLSISLSLTWLIGLFLLVDSEEKAYHNVLHWIFVLFNAFQGLFIFIVTCVKRKDMLDFWFGPIRRLVSSAERSTGATQPGNFVNSGSNLLRRKDRRDTKL